MNSIQWKLYNLLQSDTDKWFTQKEICDAISEYTYSDDDRNHCVAIGEDRIAINNDPRVDMIIVTKKHCFKIATYEEYIEERNYHIRRLKSQVAQVEAMDYKMSRNGQGKLLNNILEELKPENKQFYETFKKRGESEQVKIESQTIEEKEHKLYQPNLFGC